MLQFYLSMLETEEEQSEFERLYKAYRSEMYNIAYKQIGNRTDAEDAVQEAFLRIASKKANVFNVDIGKRQAFLHTLVKYIAVDMFRKKINHREVEYNDEIDSEPEDAIPLDDMLIGKIEHEALVKFIMSMPEATKTAMHMKYIIGLSNSEIASALNISENTLRQRLYLGRKLVKEYTEKHALAVGK